MEQLPIRIQIPQPQRRAEELKRLIEPAVLHPQVRQRGTAEKVLRMLPHGLLGHPKMLVVHFLKLVGDHQVVLEHGHLRKPRGEALERRDRASFSRQRQPVHLLDPGLAESLGKIARDRLFGDRGSGHVVRGFLGKWGGKIHPERCFQKPPRSAIPDKETGGMADAQKSANGALPSGAGPEML